MPGDNASDGTQDITNVPDGGEQAGAGTAVADGQEAPGKSAPPAQEQGKAPEGQQQAAEPAKPAQPEAVVYDLKLPKDSVLAESTLSDLTEFAKANELSPEIAQKVLEREDAQARAYEQSVIEAIQAQQSAWKEAAGKDQEIGGDKAKAAAEAAFRIIDKFGTPELKQFLDESKYGDHPEMVRFLSRIGARMAEDSFVQPGSAPGELTYAQRMYPNQK